MPAREPTSGCISLTRALRRSGEKRDILTVEQLMIEFLAGKNLLLTAGRNSTYAGRHELCHLLDL